MNCDSICQQQRQLHIQLPTLHSTFIMTGFTYSYMTRSSRYSLHILRSVYACVGLVHGATIIILYKHISPGRLVYHQSTRESIANDSVKQNVASQLQIKHTRKSPIECVSERQNFYTIVTGSCSQWQVSLGLRPLLSSRPSDQTGNHTQHAGTEPTPIFKEI